ncbi:glycosyl hydrolase [Dictyobacter kobayashii]|uniref:Asl1-like glycosyl hydrolase catalytic domain-containing protein n=1 Tax=Dictyobacter kobayashii TaxID=2014872 RepID=A0A402AU85_9CHLR|nr:glycosyl hydrolase [Dictyobacter kobayashii]GCE22647.1 hypothetical protein KDK_64470 [Dictyobacter kobayashii]
MGYQRLQPYRNRALQHIVMINLILLLSSTFSPLLYSGLAHATPQVDPAPVTPFGIQLHFEYNNPNLASWLPGMGIKQVRADIRWEIVEQSKGQYNFSIYDPWLASAQKNALTLLITLDYTNPLYDHGQTPYDVEGYQAFANYACAVLKHYGKQITALEVYNEYNSKFSVGPCQRSALCYSKLLQYTYQAVKAMRPDVIVVGGAVSELSLDWFEQLFKAGGLKYADVISDHPYTNAQTAPPESGPLDQQMVSLQQLIQRYNIGWSKPIWISELGWPTCITHVDEHTQADYLVRSAILALAGGVQKFFWYELLDDGIDANPENHFGVLRFPDVNGHYAPKPAYTAFAVLVQEINGRSFIKSEKLAANLYSELFSNNLRVLWSPTGPRTITITTSTPLTIITIDGSSHTYTPTQNHIVLTLNADPIYLQGTPNSIQPQTRT